MRADLTCFGKIIGGGLPVGAFGGRAEVMRELAPEGPCYQAGTLSGTPWPPPPGWRCWASWRGRACYERLEERGAALEDGDPRERGAGQRSTAWARC